MRQNILKNLSIESRKLFPFAASFLIAAIAVARPGVSVITTSHQGVAAERRITASASQRAAFTQHQNRSLGRGAILWSVFEPIADIDRSGVAVSGDGQSVIAGFWLNDERISLYDMLGAGTPIWTFTVNPATSFFVPVAIASSSAVNAGTSDAEPFYQWGSASATPDFTHPYSGSYLGKAAAAAATGGFVVAGSSDKNTPNGGAIEVYDTSTGNLLFSDFTLSSVMQGIDVASTGSTIVANEYSTVNVWDVATRTKIASFPLTGNTQTIARISQDGQLLAFGNFAGNVLLYRYDTGTAQYLLDTTYTTGDTWVTAIDISDDGSTVMAGTWNNTTPFTGAVYMLDVASGSQLWSDPSYGDYVQSVELSADGSRGIAASWGRDGGTQGNIVSIYERTSSTPIFAIPDDSIPNAGSAFAASISDDGQFAAAGGKKVHARKTGNGGWLVAISVPNGLPTVASICPDRGESGQQGIPVTISGQDFDPAATVSFSPAGITLTNVTVASATTITAMMAIASSATPGSYDITVTNPGNAAGTGVGLFTVTDRSFNVLAAPGAGPQNPPHLLGFTAAGTPIPQIDFYPYGATGFGTNVAGAYLHSGIDGDILTGPGPGSVYGPQIRAFDRAGNPINKVSFYAYGGLRFGANVSSGDLDCDAFSEIFTGAGPGAVFGPHARGWNYDGGALSPLPNFSFFAYKTLRFGVNPEAADLDGDGLAEVLTGAGPGTVFGPQVRGFNHDGSGIASIGKVNYFAFTTTTYGVSAAGGDVDNDGYDEIVSGLGPGPTFNADFAGHDYDGATISPLPGYSGTAIAGTLYGASFVRAGDSAADGIDEASTGPGPDPSATADFVLLSYSGGTITVSTPVTAFTTSFGVKAALADTGY